MRRPSGDVFRGKERVWGWLAITGAASAPFALLAILLVLLVFAWPAVVWNGVTFLTGKVWNLGNLYGGRPVVRHGFTAASGASYGALAFIVGTLLSSAIALVLATPAGVGVAVCLSELAGPRLRTVLGFFIELIAGVPSVVFGLWGFVVLVPWISRRLGPFLASHVGFLPFLAGPVRTGSGLLAASLVLAVMILPIVAAVSRDALAAVPAELREQGRALGLTDWEVVQGLIVRTATPGIVGGVILALGRALGETMAVLMVSGNALNYLPQNLYSPISTIAATIVSLLDSAMTDATGMAVHALAELAVVLFIITVGVNLLVPWVSRGFSAMRRA